MISRFKRAIFKARWLILVVFAFLVVTSCKLQTDTRQLPSGAISPSVVTQSSPDPLSTSSSSLADKFFKDSASPGSRALCAAEHADCPATGQLPTKAWYHIDAGDNRLALGWCTVSPFRREAESLANEFRKLNPTLLSEWEVAENAGTAALQAVKEKIPSDWARLADDYCSRSALTNAKEVEQQMRSANIPVGPAFLIRGADQWNQRPLAATFYVDPALKQILGAEGLLERYRQAVSQGSVSNLERELEAALRSATVESFREDGIGDYWAGGPIDPQTGKPQWEGLFPICRDQPAYAYLVDEYGPVDSQDWKKGCIAHNQNGRTDRIKDQLKRLNAWSFSPSM